ncbi:hypothetical protein SLS62_000415 [Diatrype stigma]|uniref:Uncharacterized protein n=1 Tax=Diatrype stigma TaxID=117547 RepID=A0AAN9VC45_9PEZI
MADAQKSQTQAMSFLRYPQLPDELKLAIWKQAVPSPAVHHFKLKLPDDNDALQVMTIEPISSPILVNPTEKQDPSGWRYTWIYSAVDTIAHELIDLGNRLLIWQLDKQKVDKSKKKLVNKPADDPEGKAARYGCKAMIDASQDLVRFKFVGTEFDPWSLSRYGNRALLKGIKRVALDWKTGTGVNKNDWIIRPLECTCNTNKPHEGQEHCHHSLAKFLALFEDLEAFYFVLDIKGCEIDRKWLEEQELQGHEDSRPQPRGTKRTCSGMVKRRPKPKGKPAVQLIKETMDFFREAAEANDNLETFHDRIKTFYEVRPEDTMRLMKHNQMWAVIHGLRRRWRAKSIALRLTPAMRERAEQTKFKVLVYADPPKNPERRLVRKLGVSALTAEIGSKPSMRSH